MDMRHIQVAVRSITVAFSASSNRLLLASYANAYPNASSASKKVLSFHSQSNTLCNMSQNNNETRVHDLQTQWAEGKDIWPNVPVLSDGKMINHHRVMIQTKVVPNTGTSSISQWPDIVTSRILYGFGAYNPRGNIVPDEINIEQHQKLNQDIVDSLKTIPDAVWWEGASIWQDGSSERGFILAFPKKDAERGLELSVNLATKYNQGAIYKFEYQQERLIRNTIAVLDEGTDASVQVEIDDSPLDVNPFSMNFP
jgi:hypothetical protein